MSNIDIIRAWKDEAYRNSLSPTEQASLPPNPVGTTDLSEVEMSAICGGGRLKSADEPIADLGMTLTTGKWDPCCSSGEFSCDPSDRVCGPLMY